MKNPEKEKLIDQIIEKMTKEELKTAARVGITVTLNIYSEAVNTLKQLTEIKKEKNNG